MERVTLGKMQNPVRGFLHGSAALLSLAGLAVLVIRTAGDPPRMWSMVVFGLALLALYTTSALYHSIPWSDRAKPLMQRIDHSMIYVLIAGTFTPLVVVVLDGGWRVGMLVAVWSVAAFGIVQKAVLPAVRPWFTVLLATLLGWAALIPIGQWAQRLDPAAIWLTLLGGILYTVGMVFYATRRPRLFPRVFSYHELFHVLVVAGSLAHFVMIWLYVVPYPA
jgi:hemolysin III